MYGKVYIAEHKINRGTYYTIKMIRKHQLLENDSVEYTKLEMQIMFECDHPFLMDMKYLFASEHRLYFVMPYIPGHSLYVLFQKMNRLQEDIIRFYAIQIVVALGHLHSKNIVYRNMKPENIMLCDDGYIKLLDFGFAKKIEEKSLTSTMLGTY